MTTDLKNILLLSTKSAGSSAVQQYLAEHYAVSLLPHTSHQENETLFWTKAASALNLPQEKMHRSVVPYPADKARTLLPRLLHRNGIEFHFKNWNEAEVFEAWRQIAERCGPVFFEKSPHHLFNRSNLELIGKCKNHLVGQVEFLLFGLVRNPMDTIYSAWRRWHFDCAAFEKEWFESYDNLRRLIETEGIPWLRYEEITANPRPLEVLMESFGIPKSSKSGAFNFHNQSLQKWRDDHLFAHRLAPKTIELAKFFGYRESDLTQENYFWQWPIITRFHRLKYEMKKILKG